ncbi:MAG: DUF2797 domain-containing protein, partial [Thermoplasmatota archaeon]
MFKSAQDILKDREKIFDEREVHVVSYKWDGFSPSLRFFDGEKIDEINLGKIDFNISQEKICIGSFEDKYKPCPYQKNVDRFVQCQDCAPSDIPNLKCIFEPGNCEGCVGGFCEKEHVVYLVFIGKYAKIGLTMKERFNERLIEQGADAYALLATVENRIKARKEEKELSSQLKIPENVSAKKKLKEMSKKIDKELIRIKYRGVKNRVPVGTLHFLKDYPITQPLRATPRLRPTPGLH